MEHKLFFSRVFRYAGDHYATVQIEILGAKFQILGPRCAPHYFSGPSSTTLGITTLQCKSKFWAQNFKFWARDVHPTISQAQVKTCWAQKTNSRSTHPRSNEIPNFLKLFGCRRDIPANSRETGLCKFRWVWSSLKFVCVHNVETMPSKRPYPQKD